METQRIVRGDLHDGKSVMLKRDQNNFCISKPRNASVETAFKTFLTMLEEKGFIYIPGTVNIIHSSASEHIVEMIHNEPVHSLSEISMYYRRSGVLLFLAYLFSSTDLHRENIIAHGGFPTIIDYETLFTGMTQKEYELEGKSLISSVYASQLLPYWKRFDGIDYDLGGLSGYCGIKDKETYINGAGNILCCNGEPVYSYQNVSNIVEGFYYAYEFALENKSLFKLGIELFRKCTFRAILRPTQVYISVAKIVQSVDAIERVKLARSLLERAYLNDRDPCRIQKSNKVLDAEIEAVLNGEAPLFLVEGDSTALCNRKGILQPDFYIKSPISKACDKLQILSIADKKAQGTIIKQSLETVRPLYMSKCSTNCAEIMDIFHLLETNSIHRLASCWTHLTRAGNGCLYFQSAGYGLYHGLLGILCCYAAIYSKTKNDSVLNALYEHYIEYKENAIPDNIMLDSFVSSLNEGAGGHILSLIHISELTGDNRFFEDAQLIARAIVLPDDLPEENDDILSGYSGLAIALPYIERETALPIAKVLLKKLLKYTPKLTGAAHGAGGVALALCSLYQVLKEDAQISEGEYIGICEDDFISDMRSTIDNKILKLLRWENTSYSEDIHNWRDLRYKKRCGHLMGWCSGAPGIGMLRKKILEITDNREIKALCEKDIERAKDAMRGYRAGSRDCLCCGNSARLMAASKLNIQVDDIYKEVVNRMKSGKINLHHIIDTCDFIPGLMQGYAGIGYALAMYGDERAGNMLL